MNGLVAMTFATPWIAWAGALAAAGPVVLHLLNRRRYRPVKWAAMQFLAESRHRNRRRLLVEDLILLALRCVLILLIAAAVARPRSAAYGVAPAAGVVDHWFVLDDSASMGAVDRSRSAFAVAIDELASQIEATTDRHRVAIYRTSDRGRPWLALGRPEDRAALAGRVASMNVSDTAAGLSETLAAVAADASGSDEHRRVMVISDFRRVDVAGESSKALSAQLAAAERQSDDLILLDVGRPVAANLGVHRLRLLDRHAIAGLPVRVAATIVNTGRAASAASHVTVSVGAVSLPVVELAALGAGERCDVEIECVFGSSGQTVLKAQLPADALAADNTSHLVVDVRDRLNVLIVDGQYDPSHPTKGESYYLAAALDPTGDGAFGVRPEVLAAAGVANAQWEDYDLVVLAGVGDLPAEVTADGRLAYRSVDELHRYVSAGGGLALFTGERVNVSFYNDVLHKSSLSPLMIGPAVGDVSGDRFVRFSPGSAVDSPVLGDAFAGEMAVLAGLFRFYRYTPAIEQPAEDAPDGAGRPRVLMRFDDERRSPAIVERTLGAGRVMMVYSTAGARWNDWPKSTNLTYLPVMNDMVAYLARAATTAAANGPVGRPIGRAIPDAAAEATIRIKTPAFPDVDLQDLPVALGDGGPVVSFADTRWAGVYEVSYASVMGSRRVLLGRVVAPAESELARPTDDEIAAITPPGAVYATAAAAADSDGPVREYWRWLMILALIVLCVESFLAHRFGHHRLTPQAVEQGGRR